MRIAVDAMGGDHAPEAPTQGSLLAMPQCSAELLLIGNEKQLREILGHSMGASSIRVVHVSEVIGMGEAGPVAIRKKRGASLSVAMRLLAEGEADAVVSAGNTAAIVATAKHLVGLLPGLRRPAMAVPLPTPTGRVLLIDAGAQAEANTIDLAQSAALAHVYLKASQGLSRPRVGLLNIGREALKGMRVIQRAFILLQRSGLHFIGNIEPQELFTDRTDAAICDGFVGNILLKMYEGVMESLLEFLKIDLVESDQCARERLGQTVQRFQGRYDYQNIGGAPLLGVRKTVVVAHGRSQPKAVANAILLASQLARDQVCKRISAELEKDSVLVDLKHDNTALMLNRLRSKWGFAQKQSSEAGSRKADD
jgi:glycerol-3-phosphate acyltransferase PlsX